MQIAICAEKDILPVIKDGLSNFCTKTRQTVKEMIFGEADNLFYHVRDGCFDVVFIALSGALGMETATKVKELDPLVQLVWISNDSDFGPLSYRLGAKLFLVKPLTTSQIEVALEGCEMKKLSL